MLLVVLGFKKIGFLLMLGGHDPQACSLFVQSYWQALLAKSLFSLFSQLAPLLKFAQCITCVQQNYTENSVSSAL